MIGIGLWIERPGLTPPVFTGDESVHYRAMLAVQSRLREISFPPAEDPAGGSDIPLTSDSIVVKKLPLERAYKRASDPLTLPCILITPQRVIPSPTSGPTSYDDYTRPVLVTMVMADNSEPTLALNLDTVTLWQEKVMRAFQNQRLAGVAEVLICNVEPAEAIIPVAWSHGVTASAVLLKFICREPRGIT